MTSLEGDQSLSQYTCVETPIKLRYTLHYVDTKMTDFIFSLSHC